MRVGECRMRPRANAGERRGGRHLSSACPRIPILIGRDECRRGQPPVHMQGRLSRTCMGKEHPGRSSVSLTSWSNGANHHFGLLLVGRRFPISIKGRREEGGSRGTGKSKRSAKIRVAGRLAGVEGSKIRNELRFEKEEKRMNQVKYLRYYSDG